MKTMDNLKYLKIVVLFSLLGIGNNLIGQIQLLNIDVSECDKTVDLIDFKPIYKQVWINDSVLQIQTKTVSNCVGVYRPKINQFGPLIYLSYNDFADDLSYEKCICIFCITWNILNLKHSDTFVLLNGEMSSDYDKKKLENLVTNYEIIDRRLINVVDKNGLRQGFQSFDSSFYKNGLKE